MAKKQKKITSTLKLVITPGAANPSPPVGPALGQKGVNIMEFCKAFNDKTKQMDKSLPIPAVISVYEDRSFSFILKTPPASALIKKMVGLKKGSPVPHTEKVGKITRKQLEEIAQIKEPDLTAADMDAAVRTIAGTARNMGVEAEGVK